MMSTKPHPPEVRAAALAAYTAGATCEEVGESLGISPSAVNNWAKTAGVIRPRTIRAVVRTCTLDGCDEKHVARGYCRSHYGRLVRGYEPRGVVGPFNRDDRLEDCRWMAEHGETLTGAAKRIGITPNALGTWLRKHDPDTLRPLLARDVYPAESRATFHGVAS